VIFSKGADEDNASSYDDSQDYSYDEGDHESSRQSEARDE
jgi:hypothetical protein